jgi:uncharacterized protein YndB with AHSA1/START domain
MDYGKLISRCTPETGSPMKRVLTVFLTASALYGAAAHADVIDAASGGFTLVSEVTIKAPRSEVWRIAVDEVGDWWNGHHTISGDAGNISIDARPLGCFCESLGSHAAVVHLTVTFVNPGVLLRLTGGLGPLGLMGVDGNMPWEFFDEDDATRVRFAYAVGGYYPGGLDTLAAPVDGVMGDALLRLRARAETGNADNATAD